MPQVEVSFDIDANGILHVSAKDKATGKEQSIRITASSGLSEAEVKRMIEDAETHKAEDHKMRELIDARNQADGMIHATEKSIKDLDGKVDESEKKAAEAAIADLKEAIKGDDKAIIESKTEALAKISGEIAQKAYAQAAQHEGEAHAGAGTHRGDDDVVDAEFEEVKDK
jgi:molecular chaperone DnaK